MKEIYTTLLTGVKMQKRNVLAADLKEGSILSVHARPDNAYDAEAMSVHAGPSVADPQVGWIPAKEFEDRVVKGVLFRLVRHGVKLEARVVGFDPDELYIRAAVCLAPSDAV